MSFKNEVESLIMTKLSSYRNDHNLIASSYGDEQRTLKDYNGRQLLELLQNAEDEGATDVFICLNTRTRCISVSNTGTSFTSEGIRSLMYPSLSTKLSGEYIGNKGLGFRSVLNWADEIKIYTQGCCVAFSNQIACDVFETRLGLSPEDKKYIRQVKDLRAPHIPFPILGIPHIMEDSTNRSPWSTIVELKYKQGQEFEVDIREQLNNLPPETLLFLRHITKITIEIDGATSSMDISHRLTNDSFETVSLGREKWKIFSKEDILPQECQSAERERQQRYNLKIALKESLGSPHCHLFSFFPTKVPVPFPCIIHGTFELDSSRNQLILSKANSYMLAQLVLLLNTCAIFLTRKPKRWDAIRLLNVQGNDFFDEQWDDFYKSLDALRETAPIYPCIDGSYRKLSETCYYDKAFNSFFAKNAPGALPELLCTFPDSTFNPTTNHYEHRILVQKIDNLAKTRISNNLRVKLIDVLSQLHFKDKAERFSLLTNDKNEIIPKTKVAFSPVTTGTSLSVPKFVPIDFVNSDLYGKLFATIRRRFATRNNDMRDQRREIQRVLEPIINHKGYEPANVIDRILLETRAAISSPEKNDETKRKCVREMVRSLYSIFSSEKQKSTRTDEVPLIAHDGTVVSSGNLYLSESYPSGYITREIYGSCLPESAYLAEIKQWKIDTEDIQEVENFFLWLGVNKLSKIKTLRLQNSERETKEYFDFLGTQGTPCPTDCRVDRLRVEPVAFLSDFTIISRLPLSNMLLLILKDTDIRNAVDQTDISIRFNFANSSRNFSVNYSYIRYQFVSSGCFRRALSGNSEAELIRDLNLNVDIDYVHLEKFQVSKADIDAILPKLGAQQSIEPSELYSALNRLADRDKDNTGVSTQKIYKQALEVLISIDNISPPKDLRLFAFKNGIGEYYSRHEIYYFDNDVLPKKILSQFPILNLPKRAGVDNVVRCFGINTHKTADVSIVNSSLILHSCNGEFQKEFEMLKPYFLAVRLGTSKKKAEEESTRLKRIRIDIVTQGAYQFEKGDPIQMDDGEFIPFENSFCFCKKAAVSITDLKRDTIFCDAFAEMLCILFKVNEHKNDFRHIFRNTDISDTRHLIELDFGCNILEEAYDLLGLSRIEDDFWKKVYRVMNIVFLGSANSETLRHLIQSDLSIELPPNYVEVDFVNFSNQGSLDLIRLLHSSLKCELQDILPPCGLAAWHLEHFINEKCDIDNCFQRHLWAKLDNTPNEQEKFIPIISKYKNDIEQKCSSLAHEFRFRLDIDYSAIIRKYLSEQFNVDFETPCPESIPTNLYSYLLSPDGPTENEFDEHIRSLLYFAGNEDRIRAAAEQMKQDCADEQQQIPADTITQIGTFVDSTLSRIDWQEHSSNRRNGTSLHTEKNDRKRKQKGLVAERLVYNTLVRAFGDANVQWVSGNSDMPDRSDSYHYDILYKNAEGVWKYLEVKASGNGVFYMSGKEVETGIMNPDKYELALVDDNRVIHLVKKLFKFGAGETFDNTSRFSASVVDYRFSVAINSNNKEVLS